MAPSWASVPQNCTNSHSFFNLLHSHSIEPVKWSIPPEFLSLSLTLAHGFEVTSWRNKASKCLTLSLTLSVGNWNKEEPEIFSYLLVVSWDEKKWLSLSQFCSWCLVGKKRIEASLLHSATAQLSKPLSICFLTSTAWLSKLLAVDFSWFFLQPPLGLNSL